MIYQVEEHCNVNQDSIAQNTRSKRRAIEDVAPPPPNQASTSNAIPHEQSENDQANAFRQQKQSNSRGDTNDPKVIPTQPPTHAAPKASTITPNASFNVVEKMKKTNVNISMWDVVAIVPMQKRLLQQELESIEPKDHHLAWKVPQAYYNHKRRQKQVKRLDLLLFMFLSLSKISQSIIS